MQLFEGKKPNVIIIGSLVIYVVLSFIAMSFYAGGHIYDLNSAGYSFSQNFFSDMGHSLSLSGENNTLSKVAFLSALVFILVAQSVFYLSEYFRHKMFYLPNISGLVCGLISIFGIVVLIVFPNDSHKSLHILGVYIWLLSFLVYVFFYIYLYYRSNRSCLYVIAISIPLYMLVSLQIMQNQFQWYQYMALTQKVMVYYMLGWFAAATILRSSGHHAPEMPRG